MLSFPGSLCFPPGACRQRHSGGKWHQHLLWSHDLQGRWCIGYKCNHSAPKFICIRSLKEVGASQMAVDKTAVANSLYILGQISKSPLSVTVNKLLCFLHLILTKIDKYNDKNEKVERCQSCTLTALSQAFSKSHDIMMPEVRQLSAHRMQQKSVTYSNQGL